MDKLRSYAKARNWIIVDEIIDHGYSGTTQNRPGLRKLNLMANQREFYVLLVLKLVRLFRSLKHIVTSLTKYEKLNIEFISLMDNIDLSTSSGKLMMHMIASFSEFEASLIRERTILGLEHAKRKGIKLGRPSSVPNEKILALRNEGLTYSQIQTKLKCSKGAVWRALKTAPKSAELGVKIKEPEPFVFTF